MEGVPAHDAAWGILLKLFYMSSAMCAKKAMIMRKLDTDVR